MQEQPSGPKKFSFLSWSLMVTSLLVTHSPSRQVTMSSLSDWMRIVLGVEQWAYSGNLAYSPLEYGPTNFRKVRRFTAFTTRVFSTPSSIRANDRIALTIACSGIDARVAKDVHKFSESPILDGKSSYIVSLAVNFLFKGIGTHWTVTLDGVSVEKDYAVVAVCNGRYYGGGFMPVAEARMDDGVLNTLVVDKVSRSTFLKFVGPYSKGEYHRFPHLAHCSTAKDIVIDSEKKDIVTCLDGECITTDHVHIRLADQKLNFFGPDGCSCNATARETAPTGE